MILIWDHIGAENQQETEKKLKGNNWCQAYFHDWHNTIHRGWEIVSQWHRPIDHTCNDLKRVLSSSVEKREPDPLELAWIKLNRAHIHCTIVKQWKKEKRKQKFQVGQERSKRISWTLYSRNWTGISTEN